MKSPRRLEPFSRKLEPSKKLEPSRKNVRTVMQILHNTYPTHPMHDAFGNNSFHMLVAVVLSQRATDRKTIPTAQALFTKAKTPKQIAALPQQTLENILKPIGFYRQKSRAIQKLSLELLRRFHGKVPSTEKKLLSLPQVGRKTANIILTMFFGTPQIAVDVHVHRIANRLGWIRTKTPEETEKALTNLIPREFVGITNQVFVRHGQEICAPVRPKCSICPILSYCQRVGVEASR